MSRVIFKNNNQREFLQGVKRVNRLNDEQFGELCKVSPRTIRDWMNGKYNISGHALKSITKKFSIPLPKNIEFVGDYWYCIKGARKGALRRNELYGPPGTPEGRRKGGVNSQLRRKQNPEKYKALHCYVQKEFLVGNLSVNLAEAMGIILGDGALTNYQLRVTLSSLVDREYAEFVRNLFLNLFGEKLGLMERTGCHTINLTLSGVKLISELERLGLLRGNKVRNQIDFPEWIWDDIEYQKACIRGLMDTDGGCYFHTHRSNGLIYKNFGMSFANESLPLVQSFAKVLRSLGLKFSIAKKGTRVYIYSFSEIKKYFGLVGSNNPKILTSIITTLIKKAIEYLIKW